jgi:K+-sensing histidine kinase KdpD
MILVCVTDQESCDRLIKAGNTLATLASLPLKVISVRPRKSGNWLASEELEYLFHLSKQLGAEMIIRFHDFAAEAVGDYIANNDVQTVVVGSPPQPGQSVFVGTLEELFPDLPIVCVHDDGRLQLSSVFQDNSNLSDRGAMT